jgi:hypothetical protein
MGESIMLAFHGKKGVECCDGLTRRDFLRVGALSAGAVGLSLGDLQAAGKASKDVNCILLFLVGGPSQLDTWDLKPNAPSTVRGPFRPIKTNVSGVVICEHFPLMAQMADRYAIVRSVHHNAAPIHETGHQLMQTGHLFRGGQEYPHYGAVLSRLRGQRVEGVPASVILPAPIGNTGVSVSHGQGAGFLGAQHEPVGLRGDPGRVQARTALLGEVDCAHCEFDTFLGGKPTMSNRRAEILALSQVMGMQKMKMFDLGAEKDDLRARYGGNKFGQSCLLARRLVEHGVGLVTVNMFDTVFNEITWDCHADDGALPADLDDYKETLCPMFDRAYTALLEDLAQRGLVENTLVVAMGEFGRTPHLNARGGRDHWPGVWSILFAGANVRGGQVIGSSDKEGGEPRDRPVSPEEVAATVYRGLGIDPQMALPGPEDRPVRIVEGQPIEELF